MTKQSFLCPHCHTPTVVPDGPASGADDAACMQCGVRLRQGDLAAAGSRTVRCIDDDPLVLDFYRDFLSAHGYRTLTVTDGVQGLALTHHARPDVILLDVMLRGLSGYDICRKFRAAPELRAIPIILLTVWDEASVATTGRAAGAARIFQKPAEPDAILTAIAEVLGPLQPSASPTERPPELSTNHTNEAWQRCTAPT